MLFKKLSTGSLFQIIGSPHIYLKLPDFTNSDPDKKMDTLVSAYNLTDEAFCHVKGDQAVHEQKGEFTKETKLECVKPGELFYVDSPSGRDLNGDSYTYVKLPEGFNAYCFETSSKSRLSSSTQLMNNPKHPELVKLAAIKQGGLYSVLGSKKVWCRILGYKSILLASSEPGYIEQHVPEMFVFPVEPPKAPNVVGIPFCYLKLGERFRYEGREYMKINPPAPVLTLDTYTIVDYIKDTTIVLPYSSGCQHND